MRRGHSRARKPSIAAGRSWQPDPRAGWEHLTPQCALCRQTCPSSALSHAPLAILKLVCALLFMSTGYSTYDIGCHHLFPAGVQIVEIMRVRPRRSSVALPPPAHL
jgi:hypothetical protein